MSPPSLKMTTRCRFPGLSIVAIEVHSNPMKAVNRPGSLNCSAKAISRSQTVRVILGLLIGSTPLVTASVIHCWNAPRPLPAFTMSWTIRPHSFLRSSELDSAIIGASPRFSAWSDTTRKSRGRIRRARCPAADRTSSPLAETVRLFGAEGVSEHAGIGGIGGVQVRVAPVDTFGQVGVAGGPLDVGRVVLRSLEYFAGIDVLCGRVDRGPKRSCNDDSDARDSSHSSLP